MFIKDTLFSEVNLLKTRIENFKNVGSEENKNFRTASALRVASYMATIGFGLLAAVSTAALFIPGMIGFALLSLAAHDCYHIVKNIDEKEMGGKTLSSAEHGIKLCVNVIRSTVNRKNYQEAEISFKLKRAKNLTENTFIALPIVNLVGSFTK
mgnify:CR=1 FL=1